MEILSIMFIIDLLRLYKSIEILLLMLSYMSLLFKDRFLHNFFRVPAAMSFKALLNVTLNKLLLRDFMLKRKLKTSSR